MARVRLLTTLLANKVIQLLMTENKAGETRPYFLVVIVSYNFGYSYLRKGWLHMHDNDAMILIKHKQHPAAFFCALSLVFILTSVTNARNFVYVSSLDIWEDTILKSPAKRRVHANFGQALSATGHYEQALEEFATVLTLHDDGSVPLSELYREIGSAQYWSGRYDKAISAWQEGLRHDQHNADLLNNMALGLIKNNQDYELALKYAGEAHSIDPEKTGPLNTLGEIHILRKEYDKAAHYYLMAIELDPVTAFRYWNAAMAFSRWGKYDLAYQYAQKASALELDEHNRNEALIFMKQMESKIKDSAQTYNNAKTR
jgi:tetratricopeptide (TPR) repeat protein